MEQIHVKEFISVHRIVFNRQEGRRKGGGGVVRTLYEYVGGGVQLDSGWVTPDSVQLQCITLV